MNKFFKDNSYLSDEGKQILKPLSEALEKVFGTQDIKDMSVQEMNVLGSNMAKMVGDFVFEKTRAKNDLTRKFNEMNDPQFEAYLKAKYGEMWMLTSLTTEELDRLPHIPKETLDRAMAEGHKIYEDAMRNQSGVRIDPNLRFK